MSEESIRSELRSVRIAALEKRVAELESRFNDAGELVRIELTDEQRDFMHEAMQACLDGRVPQAVSPAKEAKDGEN